MQNSVSVLADTNNHLDNLEQQELEHTKEQEQKTRTTKQMNLTSKKNPQSNNLKKLFVTFDLSDDPFFRIAFNGFLCL